ncbi:1-(5-phosphoribosyl)-5-[(5-phosphoribosylamino)methylideneamino] imidazole-4-carboxamide isomerase [Rubripirellula obstinata]|uniref:1-(5-phosphoribosyl)-5-[(5-phosphoribosylamino)methylideneamino] imidazole-4-carboxamide isomerase n=1 Tax=Rubripirellula obstinata TaxID=406547 RepID=A0A5B1CLK2_9BACT|nr:phosphoribosylformimino-5-aminoimidazole carboxamide ribotide isomerase [Rubripirellula obstinata]KAA1261968.1 1-(5-phosphoribosyl)-5-[(5-phosphoribosylamino)methylideneamino] imidazole-4-carboxamide isomerase [Rubripirellula obstinata]
MTQFRPCIDLHQGRVKQIVGGTLADADNSAVENHVADHPPTWFAKKYAGDKLTGGHVIKLGPGNDEAATAALAAYPGGLQIGGGITSSNAKHWLDAGASHVIVTSWLFDQAGQILEDRLAQLVTAIGKSRIVIDLSCRRTSDDDKHPTWHVASDRWQTITSLEITQSNLNWLSEFADEFLIHAADVEGLCGGVDQQLVAELGKWGGLPMTYAGGVAAMEDVQFIDQASQSKLDVTVGSALDLFGGQGIRYDELVDWNRETNRS